MSSYYLQKDLLVGLIDSHILNQLPDKQYLVEWKDPRKLITANRFDIALRYFYLYYSGLIPELAYKFYSACISAQTNGRFCDPDNSQKADLVDFTSVFTHLDSSIETSGFNPKKSLIPLSSSKSILNGCHRLVSALIHGTSVACITTDLPPMCCDSTYFYHRNVPDFILQQSLLHLAPLIDHLYVAILWPSGKKNSHAAKSLFSNVFYTKKFTLTDRGAINLLFHCYRHMPWIGSPDNGYSGLHLKLFECFPTADKEVTIIVFQDTHGLDSVRLTKSKVRNLNGIGYSSIHITDTSSEALNILNLLCNHNGFHYLNSSPITSPKQQLKIFDLIAKAYNEKLDLNDFAVDGSFCLELYGSRQAADIDIISSEPKLLYSQLGYDNRTPQLRYHGLTANDLVYNPLHHFRLFGLKIISLSQVLDMKSKRAEPKDIDDIRRCRHLSVHPNTRLNIRRSQRLKYIQVRLATMSEISILWFLKTTKVYGLLRYLWHRLR